VRVCDACRSGAAEKANAREALICQQPTERPQMPSRRVNGRKSSALRTIPENRNQIYWRTCGTNYPFNGL
jgi:hypothetical protein